MLSSSGFFGCVPINTHCPLSSGPDLEQLLLVLNVAHSVFMFPLEGERQIEDTAETGPQSEHFPVHISTEAPSSSSRHVQVISGCSRQASSYSAPRKSGCSGSVFFMTPSWESTQIQYSKFLLRLSAKTTFTVIPPAACCTLVLWGKLYHGDAQEYPHTHSLRCFTIIFL